MGPGSDHLRGVEAHDPVIRGFLRRPSRVRRQASPRMSSANHERNDAARTMLTRPGAHCSRAPAPPRSRVRSKLNDGLFSHNAVRRAPSEDGPAELAPASRAQRRERGRELREHARRVPSLRALATGRVPDSARHSVRPTGSPFGRTPGGRPAPAQLHTGGPRSSNRTAFTVHHEPFVVRARPSPRHHLPSSPGTRVSTSSHLEPRAVTGRGSNDEIRLSRWAAVPGRVPCFRERHRPPRAPTVPDPETGGRPPSKKIRRGPPKGSPPPKPVPT